MINIFLFQALGDNLISLSILEQLDREVKIVGTKHTKNIINLMDTEKSSDIKILFEDIPAFYDIKKQGIKNAITDFFKFIKYINDNKINELILEKKDFRSKLLSYFTKAKIYTPNILNRNVYKNRIEIISQIYNQDLHFQNYNLQLNNSKIIIMNPLTRELFRNINTNHLEYILNILKKQDYIIYLIDFEHKYKEFSNKVSFYLTNTTLFDMKNLLNKCDLYIGGDSFLIHLAYYLKRNYFMVFYRDNDDFLPPNITNDFYIKAHDSIDFEAEISYKFKKIGINK